MLSNLLAIAYLLVSKLFILSPSPYEKLFGWWLGGHARCLASHQPKMKIWKVSTNVLEMFGNECLRFE